MIDLNAEEKNFFPKIVGVIVVLVLFILVNNMTLKKMTIDTVTEDKNETVVFSSPAETTEFPVAQSQKNSNVFSPIVIDENKKNENVKKAINEEIIYEFPTTEKNLLQ